MSEVASFLTPEDAGRIANLQVLARLVVEGFCSGLHRSPHKGFSVEFRQHRPYVPGDEIRHLDWKIYGKSDRFYVREYEEETNVRAMLLLDVSGSMNYGDGVYNKHHYAVRVAAALAYLMLRQADGVGLVTFDRAVRDLIPTRSRPSHLGVLTDVLRKAGPGGETDLGRALNDLAPKLHRRGLLILISDCFGEVAGLQNALAHFRHAHHEVIVLQIWHRDEVSFPFRQWTRFDGLEVSGHRRLVDPESVRAAYLERVERHQQELRKICSAHRIDLVPLVTDQPYARALAEYLSLRKRRA